MGDVMSEPFEEFDTQTLLDAVDDLDSLRALLGDGPAMEPPKLRADLMDLHRMAMAVVHHGSEDATFLVDRALDIEDQIEAISETVERIRTVLEELTKGIYQDD